MGGGWEDGRREISSWERIISDLWIDPQCQNGCTNLKLHCTVLPHQNFHVNCPCHCHGHRLSAANISSSQYLYNTSRAMVCPVSIAETTG